MMPGQEKIVMDFYQKNPSAAASLRGTVYENKIIEHIKSKAKSLKKEISKFEAENLIKEENEKHLKAEQTAKSKKDLKNKTSAKKTTSLVKKPKKTKKVSKK